jgi:hypothetical protein
MLEFAALCGSFAATAFRNPTHRGEVTKFRQILLALLSGKPHHPRREDGQAHSGYGFHPERQAPCLIWHETCI